MYIRGMYGYVRARIARIGIAHADVAAHLELHPTALSAILRGRRQPPAGFEARLTAALDLLEEAEKAASEARARVLAEGRTA